MDAIIILYIPLYACSASGNGIQQRKKGKGSTVVGEVELT
jgi:hypothetical protein